MYFLHGESDLRVVFEPIDQSLPWLVGLVAIYAPADSSPRRFVYPPEHRPIQLPENATACDWFEMGTMDQNGDLYALQDCELFIPGLAQSVNNIYFLERFYQESGHFKELLQTWSILAKMLEAGEESNFGDLSSIHYDLESIRIRLYSLAAPALLAKIPRRNLLFIVPSHPPKRFAESLACQLIYLGEPPAWDYPAGVQAVSYSSDKSWQLLARNQILIGLKELPEMDDVLKHTRLLDIRKLMRDSGLEGEWPETLGEIVRYLFPCKRIMVGAPAPQPENVQAALQLMVEKLLFVNKCTDLLAVILPDNLQDLLEHGHAIYLYQDLLQRDEIQLPSGARRLALDHYLQSKELRQGFGKRAFALEIIKQDLVDAGLEKIEDLKPILHNAGKELALGETAWKAARLSFINPENQNSELVLELMIYCLNTLGNVSYGNLYRSEQLFESLYYAINDLLDGRFDKFDERKIRFYHALQIWFRLHIDPSTELSSKLEKIVSELGFPELETQGAQEPEAEDFHLLISAYLRRTCSVMASLLNRGGQPDRVREVIEMIGLTPQSPLQRVAYHQQSDVSILLPSEAFLYEAARFSQVERDAQQARSEGLPVDRKLVKLREISKRMQLIHPFLNCAPHEKALLQGLYRYALQHNEEFILRISGAPWLEAECLEREIHLQKPARLTFLLRNNGQARAENIELEVGDSHDFNLVEERSIRLCGTLMAKDELQEEFQIDGQRLGQTSIQLKVTFLGNRKKETLEYRFPLNISAPPDGFWKLKENPYAFGNAVKDHHLYFGQKDLLNSLVQNLAERIPQNTLLGGGRRSGKTSTFFMLIGIIKDTKRRSGFRDYFQIPRELDALLNSFTPIYLDLQGLSNPVQQDGHPHSRMDETDRGIGEVEDGKTWVSPSSLFRNLLSELKSEKFTSDRAGQLLEQVYINYESFKDVFVDLCRRNPDRKLVVFLDEFDKFSHVANQEPSENLRNLISVIGGATWFVSSAYGYIEAFGDYRSPLFNVFKIVPVEHLDRASAIKMITSRWSSPEDLEATSNKTLKFMDDALAALLFETGCQPFFIQLVCQDIINAVNKLQTNYVRLDLVTEVIKNITTVGTGPANLNYLWDNLPGSSQAILVILIEEFHPLPDAQIVVRLLNWLDTTGFDITDYPDADKTFEEIVEHSLRQLQAAGTIVKRGQDHKNLYSLGIPMARHIFKINRAQIVNRFKRQILETTKKDDRR